MIEERALWWDRVNHRIAKAPLHLQQSLYIITKHIKEDVGGEIAFLPHSQGLTLVEWLHHLAC